ncbi:hypothetical protein [Burkholderia latens]|uniref:hypothetical protein n=1 Tax=Burkholderia latens TaxID=488446 RepID=UPI0014796534|nr:hypothetical protein [Burkholderia latens]
MSTMTIAPRVCRFTFVNPEPRETGARPQLTPQSYVIICDEMRLPPTEIPHILGIFRVNPRRHPDISGVICHTTTYYIAHYFDADAGRRPVRHSTGDSR